MAYREGYQNFSRVAGGAHIRRSGAQRCMKSRYTVPVNVTIREYREEDRQALLRNIQELQEHIACLDPLKRHRKGETFDTEAYVERLFEKIQQASGILYLAVDGGKVVGLVAGIVPKHTNDDLLEIFPHKDGRIVELYVHPSQRGKKIGVALMEKVEEYLKDQGCVGCHVDCFAPNTPALGFYHKCGYTDRLVTLFKLFG